MRGTNMNHMRRLLVILSLVVLVILGSISLVLTIMNSENESLVFEEAIESMEEEVEYESAVEEELEDENEDEKEEAVEESDVLLVDENVELIISLDTQYEVPLQNSMGISYTDTYLRAEPTSGAGSLGTVSAGDLFLIQEDVDSTWLRVITEEGTEGYVLAMETLINLPDVVPSICYNITNGYASQIVSSGYELENVSGEALYECYSYNERLEQEEFIVPVLYPMAEKICAAQQIALQHHSTLILYEAYRPYEIQLLISEELEDLAYSNSSVMAGITESPWTLGWFVSTSVSSHQKGLAIDVSLGEIIEFEIDSMDQYEYNDITQYEEYEMPTRLDELSVASVSLETPVSTMDSGAWQNVETAESMTEAAISLRSICWEVGLEPLASEWWHFSDVESIEKFTCTNTKQSLYFDRVISVAPTL